MTEKKFTRRDVLRTGAATGAGAFIAGSGLPALAQDELDLPEGTAGTLTVIHRTEYFETAQTLFRETVQGFAARNNVALDISTTNPESFGDFMGKMTAAVRAGNPPDFAYTSNVSIAQLHLLDLVEDVTDVVEEAVSRYGNIMKGTNADKVGQFDGRWKAIPFIASTTGAFGRGDKFRAAGIDPDSLDTWEKRLEASLEITDPDNEFWGWGNTVNQSGDGWGVASGILNAFGGHFTDETGTIVQFNSPETLAAYEFIQAIYDRNGKYARALPPGVESWNDLSNNEFWLAGSIGYTHNAYSLYAQGKRDGIPFQDQVALMRQPNANNGDNRDGGAVGGWLTIFKGARNVDLAKQLALDLIDPANFTPMSTAAGGLFMPAYENLWTEELLSADPNYRIIKEQVSVENPFIGASWPAQPSAQIDAIRAQGVLEQSLGNMISGRMTPAEAVADAHQKIVDIFEEGGIMQG